MRQLRFGLFLFLAGLSGCALDGQDPAPQTDEGPPNLILFLVDDLGWQDLSVPLAGQLTSFNQRYRTPNVERLAREGVTFTNAYAAAPVCTPTRTSILTGQDPARTHITYWTLNKDVDTSREHPSLKAPDWKVNGLSEDQVVLPALLKSAGYQTIHVGKAHVGAHNTYAANPEDIGFDVNIAGHGSGAPGSYYGTHNFTAAGRQNKPEGKPTPWDVPGLDKYHGQDIFLTEALIEETLPALRRAHGSGKPFFLNFCTYAVHTPIMANKKLLGPYEHLDEREAAYATLVESYDRALGKLLDELDRLGATDNTVIVFASDNGGLSAIGRGGEKHTHNAPLRSGKGSAYEGGVRVPTIVRWPGVGRAGTREATPIISADFFSTFLAAAGASIPANDKVPIDGNDLAPLLRGTPEQFPSRTLGWNQPHQWGATGPGIEPFTSIRQGDWKLIWWHARRNFELYDLSKDLGETQDQAQQIPGKVMVLADAMQTWIDDRGAQVSLNKKTGKPILGPAKVARGMH